jgi:hypothetical protein
LKEVVCVQPPQKDIRVTCDEKFEHFCDGCLPTSHKKKKKNMQQKQGGKTNTATTTTTSSSFNTNTNNMVRPRANAHLFKKAR